LVSLSLSTWYFLLLSNTTHHTYGKTGYLVEWLGKQTASQKGRNTLVNVVKRQTKNSGIKIKEEKASDQGFPPCLVWFSPFPFDVSLLNSFLYNEIVNSEDVSVDLSANHQERHRERERPKQAREKIVQ